MEHENDGAADKLTIKSSLKFLGLFAVGLVILFALFAVFLVLSDEPFAIQIGTLVFYTVLVFLLTFVRSRLGAGYSLHNEAVRRQLPWIAWIHGAFCVVVFSAQTYVLHAWSSFSAQWRAESGPKHDSPLSLALNVLFVLTMFGEIAFLRRILSRACAIAQPVDDETA
jgi:hypothetical protein